MSCTTRISPCSRILQNLSPVSYYLHTTETGVGHFRKELGTYRSEGGGVSPTTYVRIHQSHCVSMFEGMLIRHIGLPASAEMRKSEIGVLADLPCCSYSSIPDGTRGCLAFYSSSYKRR